MFLIGDTQRSISSTALSIRLRSAGEHLHLIGMTEKFVHPTADYMTGGLVTPDQDQQRFVDYVNLHRAGPRRFRHARESR